jgi:glutathione S-transferase
MADLQIIGGAPSNFVWVTRVACIEKGVPYSHIQGMPHTPEVDAIHPFGKIPVMRHGDVTLCESRAIIGYVDRVFDGPSLIPRDPIAAAQVDQWVSIVCTTLDPLWIRQYYAAYVLTARAGKEPDRASIDAIIPKMAPHFPIMDRAVAKTGHLVGDSFTLADAYLTPVLFYMNSVPESRALLAQAPHLAAYLERHINRPSIKATKPEFLVHEMIKRN